MTTTNKLWLTVCSMVLGGCLMLSAAGYLSAPRPTAHLVTTNATYRIATNSIGGDTNVCGIIGGLDYVTISNLPMLSAEGWAMASSQTNNNTVLALWINGAGVTYRSSTSYQPPYLSANLESVAFTAYRSDTLPHAIWTNYIARTNAGYTDNRMWITRSHSSGWPEVPPLLAWRTNSTLYGMPGFTAISQCNEIEGGAGQVPMTAITKRHVYFRGHSTGTADVIKSNWWGKRVWFCTSNNVVVQGTLTRGITRTTVIDGVYHDYAIALLEADLPDSITPMRVASVSTNRSPDANVYLSRWPAYTCDGPLPYYRTEQSGRCYTGVDPLDGDGYYSWYKGGDSGSPDMLPAADGLIMVAGRTTSCASLQMQSDMDALSVLSGLDTNNYQLLWVDLSAYTKLR